jgi:hypothetical protein
MEELGRIQRTDGDVISARISERKPRSSSAGIHTWLFFQPADERARPWQSYVTLKPTTSRPRSLLSMARLNIAKWRVSPAICSLVADR